jgi:1,4-alpha-glucan branching enzyme
VQAKPELFTTHFRGTRDVAIGAAILNGDHDDPFGHLGMHETENGLIVRALLPQAAGVWLIDARTGEFVAPFERLHPEGLFAAKLQHRCERFPYRLRLETTVGIEEIDDAYRFPPVLGELDRHLIREGTHFELYRKLGAHPIVLENVTGVTFAVWAPNARRVSVVGPFNNWDGRRHAMRCHYDCGVWEIFVPGIGCGEVYKFEIKERNGKGPFLKCDPLARQTECPPATASIVAKPNRLASERNLPAWQTRCGARDAPMSILEVHLGSWRRRWDEGGRSLSYRELADQLVPYAKEMGFTHLELMPIMEHPFDGSWGYQPLGLFAPTARYGTPDDFRHFVERCHDANIAVLLDWAPAHFPDDPHGLACFDGTHLYEHADLRLGRHKDWDSLIYNFGRREVANFLIASALYWFDEYDIDGLRVDAVASMLYLDYSRAPGEWLPNRHGGRENLEAINFLRRLNHEVLTRYPHASMIAEESTAWPMVTRPPDIGGLGFSYKWNLGWMNDTLRYMGRDPVHRSYHQDDLTFGLLYAFHENFILPLGHDEVVHGKGSLLGRMPGDSWQKLANLRAYYGFMFTHPGKKLLFMGDELAQGSEWSHQRELEWHLLDDPAHRGLQRLVHDLNHLYRAKPALHELDCEAGGFSWIDCHDNAAGILSFVRRGRDPGSCAVVVANFTPVIRHGYRIGVPALAVYRELLNTDADVYGGGNAGNLGQVDAEPVPTHGYAQSLALTLPPLAVVILEPRIAGG